MKLSKKKSLPVKVYLCKDETMKEGDILLKFDRPFNFYLAQAFWKRSLDKFELPFRKQLLYRNLAAFDLIQEFKLQQSKQSRVGHIDCPLQLDYPDYCNQFMPY